ncbi:MAG: hypothetical protein FJ303_08090 [Planctomycetes bacterium]|nr:hypothetical protein [Planctomycetota bacterium]
MNARRIVGMIALTVFGATASAQQASLDARWSDLTSPDEAKATRALLALAMTPKETITLLQDRLKPVKVDSKRVAQLLKQLESTSFPVRVQATAELEYLGKFIKADLEAALKTKLDIETKQRIEQLLDKMPKAKKAEAPMPNLGGGKSISVMNMNGQITIIVDGVPLDLSKAPPPPPPGPPPGWIRAVRAVTLLEHLATPEARQLLQALAAGESEALPTIAAREALERMKK